MKDRTEYIEHRRITDPASYVGRTVSLDLDGKLSIGWNLRRVTENGCVVTKGDHAVEHLVPSDTLVALNPTHRSAPADRSEDAADAAVRLLRTLGEGRIGPRLRRRGFDQIEPNYAATGTSLHTEDKDGLSVWMDATPQDISDLPRLNITAMGDLHRDGPSLDEDFYLWRVHKVAPKQVRGRVRRVSPFMAQVTVGRFSTPTFADFVFGWERDSWRDLAAHRPTPEQEGVTPIGLLKVGLGMHWNRQFQWRVLLSLQPNTPRISMITDPLGMKEVFRLRDVPPGKKRRAALRTWISEHWRRKKRQDEQATVFVRQHLRGAQDFDWNGLRCTLIPAPDEVVAVGQKYEDRLRRKSKSK